MSRTSTELLGPAGPIAERLSQIVGGYEARPEQAKMAEAVAVAFNDRSRLLVEAGTGVGKSFAYLVPAILRCIMLGEKVVIATATIALQEQLMAKDIPMLIDTLERWGVDAKFALKPILAKGRGNYLSVRRLQLASSRQDHILHDVESRIALGQIQEWAYTTRDGTLSSLPQIARPEVWDHVRSDADNCMGRKCPSFNKCFYQAARKELDSANLIICNHALFFSDLALRTRAGAASGNTATRAILPKYDHVVFDEAHTLEDSASDHFGLSLSRPRVMRLLRTLYNPRRRKGYLPEKSLVVGDAKSVDRAIHLVTEAAHAADVFFDELLDVYAQVRTSGGRVRTQNIIENHLSPAMHELAMRLRLMKDQVQGEGPAAESERFELASFARRAAEIGDCADAMLGQTLSNYVYWIDAQGDAGPGDPRSPTGSVFTPPARPQSDDDEDPFSADRPSRHGHNRPRRVTLACAPVDVAAILRKHLFSPEALVADAPTDEGGEFPDPRFNDDADDESHYNDESADGVHISEHDLEAMLRDPEPALPSTSAQPLKNAPRRVGIVLTSATLATRTVSSTAPKEHAETAFALAMTNLGVDEATTLQLGSPFDYRRQAKVIVDLTVPDPRAGTGPRTNTPHRSSSSPQGSASTFNDALARRVLHHVRSTEGGAFVLFTSNATLLAVADRIAGECRRLNLPLFVQGRDGPRSFILKGFMDVGNGVLLGAASFWQGVDVRGERLRNVIITRLPFEPPDRPLTQARLERIELQGGNPFMQDSLPRAILRFKQGFGRLIRSRSDKGQVVVLDPRIATARYGRMFLDALPKGLPVEVLDPKAEDRFDEDF